MGCVQYLIVTHRGECDIYAFALYTLQQLVSNPCRNRPTHFVQPFACSFVFVSFAKCDSFACQRLDNLEIEGMEAYGVITFVIWWAYVGFTTYQYLHKLLKGSD